MPRPVPRLTALAAGLVLLLAGPASAARLEVTRRVEPTLDRYLWTAKAKTPLAGMTRDQRWLGGSARSLVVHDSDPRVSRNLTGWAVRPKIAVYLNATGINQGDARRLRSARRVLLSSGGRPVTVDGWRAFDITKPEARALWLRGPDGRVSCGADPARRGALDLYACGYRSLWLDNALTTPRQGFTPTPRIAPRRWAAGMLAMLRALRREKPTGTSFSINMHWTDTSFGWAARPRLLPSQPQIQAARLADRVIIEGGAIDPGLYYGVAAKYPWSYGRLLRFADALHARGARVVWEKTGSSNLTRTPTPVDGAPVYGPLPECLDGTGASGWAPGDATWAAHVRTAAFNYASALLTYRSGDAVGDMCEYPDRGWRGYRADLGSPRGARTSSSGLLVRRFTRGAVAVNPTDQVRVFAVGRPGIDLASQAWPQADVPASAVTLPPRTASVVRYR